MSEQNPDLIAKLSANNLKKRYKSRTVVHDVSFEVGSGEVVGLLGPNGAGKTTCFYMIVGLVPSDGGSIQLQNQEVTHFPIHKRAHLGISYLPQEASVFRKLNVEENIRAVLELQKLPKHEIDLRLEELLEELHIGHIRASNAAALSGGERRRVEIARALATSPRFILLDEPFAGVDPIAVLEIQKIIRFLKDRPWASATGPTSSMRAGCWRLAARMRSFIMKTSEKYIWARASVSDEPSLRVFPSTRSLPPAPSAPGP